MTEGKRGYLQLTVPRLKKYIYSPLKDIYLVLSIPHRKYLYTRLPQKQSYTHAENDIYTLYDINCDTM